MKRQTDRVRNQKTLPLGFWVLFATVPWLFYAAFGQDEAAPQHEDLFKETRFPSATTCKTCHPGHYREWSVSAHAYAQMSPVFNAMHGKILKLTNGTNGDFCIRCHTPVGMNLEEPVFMSNMDRHPTSREGITCIACTAWIKRTEKSVGGWRSLKATSSILFTDPLAMPN